jgi:hypothetical protein
MSASPVFELTQLTPPTIIDPALGRSNLIMHNHGSYDVRELTAVELHDLIDATKDGNSDAIRTSVAFVIAESFGYWHNRARAKLCRHFKNNPPALKECDRMVDAISGRLTSGNFYEQFKDQLAMAIRFNRDRMEYSANIALNSDREHVVRYGNRVLHAINSIPPEENSK